MRATMDISPPPAHSALDDLQGLGFGVLMAGLGLHLLTHLGLVTGQTAGLAVLFGHFTGLPFAISYPLVSLPFLALGWLRRGRAFALKTLVVTLALSALSAALPQWFALGPVALPLGAVLVGLLLGISALAVVRHGGSFGGLSILWIDLQDRRGIRAGHAQLVSDVAIFAVSAMILPADRLLWSIVAAAVFALFLAANHRRGRYFAI